MVVAEVGCTKNIPFKTRLVLLSRGAFPLVAIRMRWEPSGERSPDLVQENLGYVDIAFPVQFDPI